MRQTVAARRLRPGRIAVVWIDAIQAAWIVELALRTAGHTTVMIRSAQELAGFDASTSSRWSPWRPGSTRSRP